MVGYERKLGQCQDKIKKKKEYYRKVRDGNKTTGKQILPEDE